MVVEGSISIEDTGYDREGEDPYLCRWAEFYFLAFLSKHYLDEESGAGSRMKLVQGVVDRNGNLTECYVVIKGMLSGVDYDGWDAP